MDRKNAPLRFRNTGKYPYLPQDLIEEIMSALPAKSLLGFKCVSKSWRCLIGSDRFIKTQLEKSMKDPSYAHWRVFLDFNFHEDPKRRSGFKQCSVRSFMDELNVRSPFDDSTNNHLTATDCKLVGHCNGLLCILKEPGGLYLWNPTTRISHELLKHDLPIEKYGFGMDEQSGAYKVFAALPEDKIEDVYVCVGKVYSSKTNSWKTIEHGCLDVEPYPGVLVGGKLHWLMKDGHYIESFDLSSEVFEMIELPEGKPGEGEFLMLTEAKGRLALTAMTLSDSDDDDDDDDEEEEEEEWVRVRVTKGGAKEHWVKVKEKLKDVVDCYGETVYVESLVWPLPLKNL